MFALSLTLFACLLVRCCDPARVQTEAMNLQALVCANANCDVLFVCLNSLT